jgi:hypothetical protein
MPKWWYGFSRIHSALRGLTADDHPQYQDYWQKTIASRYFNGTHNMGTTATQSLSKNAVHFFPVYFGSTSIVDAVALHVDTSSAGATIKLAVYLDEGTHNAPGALLASLGSISAATTGTKQVVFGSTGFPVGTYVWLAITCSDPVVLFTCSGIESWAPYGAADPGAPSFAPGMSNTANVFTGSWAANASTYTLTYDITTYPMLYVRGA